MKLLHISDLHIGKKVKGFSLLEDQEYILQQILDTAKKEKVDGIIIAGDIYDVSAPSNEAVSCFDKFISDIHKMGTSCYVVSGNHDSVYRVAFGSDIMAKENIYFAKKYNGEIKPIEADSKTNIWLLPFIRPVDVRNYHPDFTIGSYEEMMGAVIKDLKVDSKKTNILVAHQFITCSGKSPETCESETVSLGTLDNIDVSNFDQFDYVALGHIHRPQAMGRDTVRYSGSPLKYSFSEKDDVKSMIIIDASKKKLKLDFIPFEPIRDMKEFVGMYDEFLKLPKTDDFVRIVLKDEDYITDIKHKLENNFTNIMEIVYDNKYTRENNIVELTKNIEKQSPLELFKTFYEQQNNQEIDDKKFEIVKDIFESIGEIM